MSHRIASLFFVVGFVLVNVAVAGVQGTCPKPTGFGICVEDCSHHDACVSQGKLCCSNGCGHVCMDPETSGASLNTKCTLIVGLKGKSEDVIQVVPKPSKYKELKAIGMIVIDYRVEQSQKCCIAKRALDAKPEIAKFVEFDGAAPDCPLERRMSENELVAGGWTREKTAENNGLSDEHLNMWDKVLEKFPTRDGYELKKLGEPIYVKTQVVAGTNYNFGFKNDANVHVFHQPWSDTLEVTKVDHPNVLV